MHPRLQITDRGMTIVAAAVLLLAFGLWRDQHLALQFAVVLLIISAGSRWLCGRNLRTLSLVRHCPEGAFASDRFSYRIQLADSANRSRYAIRIIDDLAIGPCALDVPAGKTASCRAVGRVRHRGRYESFSATIRSAYPFGLFTAETRSEVPTLLLIYPAPIRSPELREVALAGMAECAHSKPNWLEDLGEWSGIREFRNGDPLNRVHWPLSVRYDQLVVKVYEPAAPMRTVVVFHNYQSPTRSRNPSPERTLRILTGILLAATDWQQSVTLLSPFNDWQPIELPLELDHALACLATAEICELRSLEPVQRALDSVVDSDTRVVVVSNSPVGHWRRKLHVDSLMIALDHRLKPRYNRSWEGHKIA